MDIFDRIGNLVKQAFRPALRPAARALAEDIRRRLSVPGMGVPSAPGESPRKQTGGLVGSVREEIDPESLKAFVVVAHPAAFCLEYGTQRMAARPFARPAVVSFGVRAARLVADHAGGGHGVKLGARHLGPDEFLE